MQTSAQRLALAAYDEALRLLDPANNPRDALDYAEIQLHRGDLLREIADLPNENRAGHLHAARDAYHAALNYYTPNVAPLAYAETQTKLGNALHQLAALPAAPRAMHLRNALGAYHAALRFRTPAIAPVEHAATQHSLGICLLDLAGILGEDYTARLLAALAAFDAAVTYAPANALYQYSRIGLLIRLRRLEEARAALAHARALDSQAPRLTALEAALAATGAQRPSPPGEARTP